MMKHFTLPLVLFAALSSSAQLHKSQCNTPASTALLLTSLALQSESSTTPSKPKLAYHPGIAVTNHQDTLKGTIRLCDGDDVSLIMKQSDNLNIDTTIAVKDLKLVRLYAADSLLNNGSFTDYIRMDNDKHYLWRQVYKGDFEIYDDLYASNEDPGKTGDYLLVIENGTNKEISGFWTTSPRKKMIEYVNTRYSKSFSRKDFASIVDVLNWLKQNG